MFDLTDKVVVITGAASGIGRAAVQRFAAAGARVVLADVADATALAAEVGGTYVATDVSNEAEVAALMTDTATRFGRIDVCINNAGIIPQDAAVTDVAEQDALLAYGVNALGVLWGIKHAAPHMPRGGAIINTASLAGRLGFPGYAAYAASKAAAVAITQVAAVELGPAGIRVNCVCPASVNTPQLAGQEHGDVEAAVSRLAAPLGRISQPEDIAALMHFLAADDCPMISGQIYNIDGGLTAGFPEPLLHAVATAALAQA